MLEHILHWLNNPHSPRSLLLYGPIGSGKSSTLSAIPAYFPALPLLRLPAHLSSSSLTSQTDWHASLVQQRHVQCASLEQRLAQSLVLVDDIHRMDGTVLSILLRVFEKPAVPGRLIASCLEPQLLGGNISDRFAWSVGIPKLPLKLSKPHKTVIQWPALGHWPDYIATQCAQRGYGGHRAEIAWTQAAALFAAYSGDAISPAHVEQTLMLALGHRQPCHAIPPEAPSTPPHPPPPSQSGYSNGAPRNAEQPRSMPPLQRYAGEVHLGPILAALRATATPGRRKTVFQNKQRALSTRSRSVGSRPASVIQDIHLGATMRHAIPWQPLRGRIAGDALRIQREDCYQHIRQFRTGLAHILVIDASGSMHTEQRIAWGKALFAQLVQHAYPRKERVAVLVFKNAQLEIVVPLGTHWTQAQQALDQIQCQGRSPLDVLFRECLAYGQRLAHTPRMNTPNWILLSDFRPNSSSITGHAGREVMLEACAEFARIPQPKIILNAEAGHIRLGLAHQVASILQAPCFSLSQFMDKEI